MDALTEDVRDGSLMELLYAGNIALCGESLNNVMEVWEIEKCSGMKGSGGDCQ